MNKDISIIMPVLNSEKYIEEAINSILSQTISSIEILVVDAGSTDGTLEIVNRLALQDNRIKLLHSEKKSMGYQYNVGMNMAQGKYIGFVESDDCICTENILEKMFFLCEDNQLDYIKANFLMFVDTDDGREFLPVEQAKKILQSRELYNCVISIADVPEMILHDCNHWKGIYRKEFIQKKNILFNETPGAAFQDMGFVFQTLLYAERCMYIDDFIYGYRRDNNDASTLSPKGLMFAYNEFVYILNLIMGKVDKLWIKMIYKRFFSMLFSQINKLKSQTDITQVVIQAINDYIRLLSKGEKCGYIGTAEVDIFMWLNYEVLKADPRIYLEYSCKKKQCLFELYNSFIENLKSQNMIIMCGYGTRGQQLEIFLRVNGMNKNLVFCDNDESKQGKVTRTGYSIISFEQAVKTYINGLFLVTVDGLWKDEMKRQLIGSGCEPERISFFTLPIDSYIAMTKYN